MDEILHLIDTGGIVATLIFMVIEKRQDIKAAEMRHAEEISYWRNESRRLQSIVMNDFEPRDVEPIL